MTTEALAPEPAEPQEDLTGFDVDPDQIGDGDPADNFKKLRLSRDQWRTRAEAAEAAAHRGVLLEAGFVPESGEGKALLRAIEAGEVEADPETVVAHAAEEYGWTPGVFYTGREGNLVLGGQRQAALQQHTMSAQTGSLEQEYEAKIDEARSAGDFARASALQIEYERKTHGLAGARR